METGNVYDLLLAQSLETPLFFSYTNLQLSDIFFGIPLWHPS